MDKKKEQRNKLWRNPSEFWGIVHLIFLVGLTACSSGISDGTDGHGGAGGVLTSTGGAGGRGAVTNAEEDEVISELSASTDPALVLPPSPNGMACTTNGECSTGYCVDGFCCDNKCDNKCMACSAAKKGSGVDGVCGSIAYDTNPDNDCIDGACDGKNVCKKYNGGTCTSSAQCLSKYCVDGYCCGNICMNACQACSAAKKGSGSNGVCGNIAPNTNPDGECSSGGTCNGSGACTTAQPQGANGAACLSAAQCQSGYCADGVCCDSWCLATCQACTAAKKGSGANGTCGNIANDQDPDEECWGGSCDGKGVCKQYNGVPCTSTTQCLSGYCTDGFCCGNICTNLCQACSEAKKGQGYDGVCGPIASGKDSENECNPGACNGVGSCNQAQTPQTNGTTCVSGGQCASGNCVDGVCCNTACGSKCMACSVAKKGSGVDGTCELIGSERDPDNECNGGRCDGQGLCRFYNGAPCSSAGQCFSTYCVDGVCCGNACTSPCRACSAAKKGNGSNGVCGVIGAGNDPDDECVSSTCDGVGFCAPIPCTTGNQCPSGFCSNGYCVRDVVQMAGEGNQTCALFANGTVKCWGYNLDGQLGQGDQLARGDAPGEMGANLPPINLGTGKTAKQVAVGYQHVCALLTDGSVRCWGDNYWGQLGRGDFVRTGDGPNEMGDNLIAVNLGTGKTATQISTAGNTTCALLNDGTAKCWGYNAEGGLGQGNTWSMGGTAGTIGDNLPAISLGTGKSAIAIAVGAYHTCAILNDGSVKCWGGNYFGALGLGHTAHRGDNANEMGDSLPAVHLGTGKTAVQISLSYYTSCARLNDNSVKCWGNNSWGRLGLGDSADRGDTSNEMGDNLPAINLGTGKTATKITTGGHICAVLNDGTMKCWGANWHGQLGIGAASGDARGDGPNEMGDNLNPVGLGTGKQALDGFAGGNHTCAILHGSVVKCWGGNEYGQLGLGDTISRGVTPSQMGDSLPTVSLF